MAYITIKNLKKSYQVTKNEKQDVLNGIDVEFQRGEFVALLGESGCGKSTFLNILSGLDFDYSGSIIFKGEYMSDFSEKDFDIYRKSKVGVVFQSFNLIKQMTAYENIMLPLMQSKLSQEERKKRVESLLEEVGLVGHSHKFPNQLSGGQKQRVAIARALANNPSVLLADEPTGNLDAKSADEIMELLKNIAMGGKLVVCVTHSAKVASNCTRVLTMEDGLIVKDESAKNYKTSFSEKEKPTAVKDSIDKKEILVFAKNNILQDLKRSILVAVALSIGICAFVLMFFLSAGMRNYVESELTTGMNRLQINVYRDRGAVVKFEDRDLHYLNALVGQKNVINGSVINNFEAEYLANADWNKLFSVASTYNGFSAKLLAGRVPSNEAGEREILISPSMASRYLEENGIEDGEILGKTVALKHDENEVDFIIRGVLDNDTGVDFAYVSLDSMAELNGAPLNLIYVISPNVASVVALLNDINTSERLFAVRQDTLAEEVMSYIDLGSFILASVSAISLVVSAIMIFIVMYISVVERTKEIGILRALGTRRRDVKRIFITEAGILGISAGVIGCFFAIIIGLITNASMGAKVVGINPLFVLLGLATSFVVSVLSSMGPSGNGASLDPIEALRASD
ncbi:MAG: ATP-binding cassette domain-containing protein [Firmicutes bacterium]|nr:ATP-binding cassette domain-containing protein [Bacillota bacterium]